MASFRTRETSCAGTQGRDKGKGLAKAKDGKGSLVRTSALLCVERALHARACFYIVRQVNLTRITILPAVTVSTASYKHLPNNYTAPVV